MISLDLEGHSVANKDVVQNVLQTALEHERANLDRYRRYLADELVSVERYRDAIEGSLERIDYLEAALT